MHAVVTEAPASLIVLVWLLVGGHVVVTGEGVTMAAARPAAQRLQLVAGPEGFVVVEGRTTVALESKKKNKKGVTPIAKSDRTW